MKRNVLIALAAFLAHFSAGAQLPTPQTLPFSQNWTNTGLITTNNVWSGVPGILGFTGGGLTGATGTDPQTILADNNPGTLSVLANQTNFSITNGGLAEFQFANPVVAFQGSGTANAPYLLIGVVTTGLSNITVSYTLRDLDSTSDNSIQQVALQYRVGNSGNYTNVPAAYVADASSGPSLNNLTTPVSVVLPAAANNQAQVYLRIMTTNAVGNDEWIGVDNISVSGTSCPAISATINGAGNFCLSGNTGTAATPLSVTISGGTGPYTIDYTDGLATDYPAISNYTSGTAISNAITFTTTYTLVSVADANGCTASLAGSASFFVSQASPTVANSTTSNPTTCGGTDGSIVITSTSGGMGPYTYTWSTSNGSGLDGNNDATQSSLSAGTYTVVVNDANGCQSQPVNFTLNNPANCGCNLASAALTDVHCENNAETPDADDDYIWFQLQPTGTGLGTGYNVTVSSGSITFGGNQPAMNVPYGNAEYFRLQQGSAGAGNVTITITDADNPSCSIMVLINDPGSCSAPPPSCEILESGLANLMCDNNETSNNPSDDYISFSLLPMGDFLGATYTLTVSSGTVTLLDGSPATNLVYDEVATFFRLQNGSAGAGDVVVTINDADNQGCTLEVPIDDPGACSASICPTFGGTSNALAVCPNGTLSLSVTGLSNMSQVDNGAANYGITFVAFPAAVMDPYTAPGGTTLGTVTFANLGGGGTSATLSITNPLPTGSYVAYAILNPTPGDAGCRPSAQFNFQIVTAITVFNVTGGGSTCENNPAGLAIGLSGSQNGNIYRLYRDGVANLVATVNGNGNPLNFGNFTTPGTYTVVASDNSGASCTASMNGSAVISSLPESPVPTVTTPVVYCQNDVAVPLTANGVNLLWYTSLADPTGDAVAPTPSTTVVGNTSYYVTQTTSGAAQVSTLAPGDIAIISMHDPSPDMFSFVPLVNLAPGTVIYFTDNGWDGSTGAFRSVTATNSGGNEGFVKYTAPAGGVAAGTVIYNTDANFTSTGNIPNGNTDSYTPLDFAAAGDQIYAFQNSNPDNPMFNTATITHLFVLDDTNGFENATTTATGAVPPGLTAGTTANTFPFAASNRFYLNNDNANRTPAQWLTYIANSANYTTAAGSGTIVTTNLNVTLAGSSLCESDRVEIVVTINAPATANIPVVAPVCVNQPISLSVTLGGSATSGTWSANIMGGAFAPNNTSSSVTYTPPTNFTGSIVFSFTTNDPAGPCPAGVATRSVDVQTGGVNAGADQFTCAGSPVSLNGTLSGGATTPVTWTSSVAGGSFANSGALSTTYTPPAGFSGNITLTLTATSTGPCTTPQDQLIVTVNALPPAPMVTTPVTYCQNAPAVPLTATGSNLLWYTSLADVTGDPVAPTPSTAAPGTTSFYVTQTLNTSPAVSVLAPGDIAIIGLKDGADDFAFVPFVNLAPGTVIYFTDNGWTGTGFRGATATVGRGNEDIIRYTAPAGGVQAGTVIHMTVGAAVGPGFDPAGTPIPGTSGNGNNQFNPLAFNANNGDQIYAFQNTNANNPLFNVASITHLFVYDETNGFEPATSATTGDIPPGLTLGTTANTFNFVANNTTQLNNDGATRTKAQWLAYIANAANYTGATGNVPITTPDLNLPGDCESMRAQIDVTVYPSPTVFTVTGGGERCNTDNVGVPVGLSGSQVNVNYQLLLNGNPVGGLVAGTGNPLNFGPQLNTGTYTVTATAVQGSCTAPMTGSAVVTAINCTIEISDPCMCLNNATTLANGQFGEQIKVTAPGTQIWTVTAVSGLYSANSPNPPAAPTPIAVGTMLTNIGMNMFTLDGRHVDAIGYTITVSNSSGTSLTIGNTCEYPNPSITSDLSGPFCLFSDVVALTGTPGDDNIVSQGFTVNGVPATEFNPGAGVGTYVITYTVNGGEPKAFGPDDPGCIQSVSQTVAVVATPSNIVCNDLVTVSLPAGCTMDLLPDMVLEGTYPCFDDYVVEIDRTLPLGNGPWVVGTINADDIGHLYAVRVRHLVTGNSCWGNLRVEDKLPPVITCTNYDLPCNVPNVDPNYLIANGYVAANVAFPTATDCDDVSVSYKDSQVEETCASGFSRTITRVWTAVDASGNKATCTQIIRFTRPDMNDVELPENYDGLQAPFLTCGGPYPTPEYLNGIGLEGTPLVFGLPDGCNIGWTYTDERIDICEGTYKILRRWTIVDWCVNQVLQYTQLIKVVDNAGPVITAPANMRVSTNPSQCCATVNLPDVIITDNCSRINSIGAMITVYDQYLTDEVLGVYNVNGNTLTTFPNNNFWNRDTLGNFGISPCLPIGRHQVTYSAEDACGNKSFITFWITVVDETPPVATCTQFTTVAIDTDDPTDCYEPNADNCEFAGVAWVPASAFNQGSHDNCNNIEFSIRRMPGAFNSYGDCIDGLSALCDGNEYFNATLENDSIKFYCCEVGTTQTVILRVYQLDINGERDFYRNPDGTPVTMPQSGIQYIYNECMIQVEVQDKVRPTCVPPANVTVSCENFDPTLWAYGYPQTADNCCLDQDPPTSANPQGQANIPAGTSIVPDSCGLTQKVYYNGFLNANFDTMCNRGIIIRRFTAWDCQGLSSSCTQRVTVDYNQNYYIKLPDDKVVYSCNGTPSAFGYPAFYGEDCELLGVAYNDVVYTVVPDACYKIERTWTIMNWCTFNPDQPCIMVPNPNPSLISNDPANVRAPVLSPPGTPAPWAPTVIKLTPSDPAPTNYGNIWQAGANCYKYSQIIKVLDTQDPVFENCPDTTVILCDISTNDPSLWNNEDWWDNTTMQHDLCEGPADLSVSALDSCSGTHLRFRYLLFLDLDGDGQMESVVSSTNPPEPGTIRYNNINTQDFEGGEVRVFQPNLPLSQRSRFTVLENYSADATHLIGQLRFNTTQSPNVYTIPQLPHGRHKIKWIAEDLCGNETVCEYVFEIKDCKPPVVACEDVNISLMVGGMATLWATDFYLYGEDNCTPANILNPTLAIIRADENPDNTYPVDQPQSVLVTCLDEGQNVPVQVWLRDAAGNVEYCTAYVNVQANVVGCENFTPQATVAGSLKMDGQGVEQASVELTGTPNVSMVQMTGNPGTFHFSSVPLQSNLTITPMKDDNPLNGVSTYDLVLMSKHILGLQPLTTPYKMIAADANRSGSITTFDVVEFRKLILGIYNELPNNTSWRFVDKSFTFPTPSNPFVTPFPENISISNLLTNSMNNQFEGIKIGDVDGNAIANSLMSADDRTASTMLFDVQDRDVKAGEVFTVDFKGAEKVQGYQFTMNLSGLEVMDITPGADMTKENFATFENAITTSVDGLANEFSVTFRAAKAGKLSQMLGVSGRITKAEAYSAANERLSVAFRFKTEAGSTISGVGFEVYQNQPNPFVNKTFIGFHLPESTVATLKVYDETGRVIFTQKGDFAKGYNTFSIDRQLVNTTGVLYYTVETATDSATKKMIQSK